MSLYPLMSAGDADDDGVHRPPATRDTTHEYRCLACGLTFKGRRLPDGRIAATNAPPSGQQRTCLCSSCRRTDLR